jgi:hypothetical protein
MTDLRPLTLEERLSKMEAELQKANERLRALSDERRRTTRVQALTAAWVTFLLIVSGWFMPTTAAFATFSVPFTVKGRGNEHLVVDENSAKDGLIMSFYNGANGLVLQTGVGEHSTGILTAQTSDGHSAVSLGIGQPGHPGIKFVDSGTVRAAIGWGAAGGMQFEVDSANGMAVDLGEKRGNGYLLLADANQVARVEAGTLENGDGAVKAYGPTGKCGVALAGVSCLILAR